MNVICSYALFGGGLRYWRTLLPAVLYHHAVNPADWEFRIHLGADPECVGHVMYPALRKLESSGLITVRECGAAPLTRAMLWRMHPVWDDPSDTVVVCRDIDSLPSVRDRLYVQAFIRSGLPVHCIRDHYCHTGVYMMGGMVAFRNPEFVRNVGYPTWDEFIARSGSTLTNHGQDQDVLNRVVWPKFVGRVCEHVREGQARHESNIPFSLHAAEGLVLPDITADVRQLSDWAVKHIGTVAAEYVDLAHAFNQMLPLADPKVAAAIRSVLQDRAVEQYVESAMRTVPIYANE